MVRCKKCKSINVKVSDLNFARKKAEGEPSAKSITIEKEFYCTNCYDLWFSDSEAEKLYFEYKDLVPKTDMVAEIKRPNGTYQVHYIKPNELSRRIEIAKILVRDHEHDLDIEAGEWYGLYQDAR